MLITKQKKKENVQPMARQQKSGQLKSLPPAKRATVNDLYDKLETSSDDRFIYQARSRAVSTLEIGHFRQV